MRSAWRLVAALGVMLLGAAATPPVTTLKLAGGATGLVRPQSGAPVAAVELWFRAPSIGFDATPHPGISHLAALAVAASQPITGTPLAALVARSGGRFSVAVYPQTVEVSALVPATEAAAILRTMSGVYFTPVLTQDGLSQALVEIKTDQRLREIAEPEQTLRDALFDALFSGGADHFSPSDLGDGTAPTLDEVREFATRAFRAPNATVVLTGAVDAALANSAVPGRTESGAAEPPGTAAADVRAQPESVSRPGPVPGFGYAWTGPAINEERAATALDFVADYLFNNDTGSVTQQLQNLDVGVEAQYVTYHDPGVFYVEVTGPQAEVVRARIDEAIAAMKSPLDAKAFQKARLRFEYHVMSDVSTPLALADNFGWYASEGNAAYAPGADLEDGRYMSSVRALTPEFVAQTVSKYLSGSPAKAMLTAK
ncbi:MAG: M16 family metallopeptidase [Vulcanimicrobiaceae bacterium]